MTHDLNRRDLILSAGLFAGAGVLPSTVEAEQVLVPESAFAPESVTVFQYTKLRAVIAHLESEKTWETYSTVMALRFSAQLIREALDMDTPFQKYSDTHIQLQSKAFEAYRASQSYKAKVAVVAQR